MSAEQAVNVAAIARHLGIHPNTVYEHAVDTADRSAVKGEIPGFRVGKRTWRFFISEVDKHRLSPSEMVQSNQSRGRKRVA